MHRLQCITINGDPITSGIDFRDDDFREGDVREGGKCLSVEATGGGAGALCTADYGRDGDRTRRSHRTTARASADRPAPHRAARLKKTRVDVPLPAAAVPPTRFRSAYFAGRVNDLFTAHELI